MSYDSQTSSTLINKLRKDVDSLTLKVAVLTDSKTSGTSGGAGVATTWSTRTLNTIAVDPNGLILQLESNTFKLAAGAYQIRAMAAFRHTGHTRMRIYDVTASAEATASAGSPVDVVIGYSVSSEVSNQANTYIDLNLRVQPHKDNVYRLEYYIQSSGTNHLGIPTSLANINEIFAICEITRLDTGLTKPSGGSGIQGAPGPAGPVGPAGPPGPAGGGTVTQVSVVTANGVSGSVATSTTTPAITLALGAITPTSVTASGAISAGATVTGSNLLGYNSGDQVIILSGDRMLTEGSDFLITESGDYILETGDVTGQGTGRIPAVITPQAVTYDKMQYVSATDRLLGRQSAGPGLIEEITCTAAGRAILDDASAADQRTTLGAVPVGPITTSGLTVVTANRLLGRVNSAGAVEEISLGTGISFAGTVLSATGTGGTVTNVTVTPSDGITASVGTSTTTPAISLGLGAITPTSVASTGTVTGTNLSGTHTGTSSGTNTGDQIITLTGPVTGTGSTTFATTITNGAVTYDKIQTTSAIKRLLGSDASSNSVQEIILGSNLSMAGNTLSASAPGTGTVTSVNADGSTTGMSFTGGPITTSGTLTLGGTLALTNGGTGATSAAAALTSLGAYPAANPSGFTSNAGTVTTASVVTANGVSGTVATDTTTPAITIVLGAIVPTSVAATGTVTGSNLSGTHTGTSSGTNTGDQTITLTGDVGGSGTGSFAATIAANAVTYGKIQAVGASSKLLGSTASGTAVAEITLGTNLSMTGSTLNAAGGGGSGTVTSVDVGGGTTGLTTSGGPVTTSGTITLGGVLGVANGGTSSTSASSAISFLAGAVTNGQYLRGNGTVVQMSAIQAADLPAISLSTGVTGTLPIANGGTGLTAVGAQYEVLTSTGSAATWTTVDLNNSTSNVLPIAKGGTASITAQSAIDALAGSQTNGQYLRGNGTNVVMSAVQAVDLPQIALGGSAVSGTLGVINGGTGLSNVYTNGDLLIGNTTGSTLNRAKITGTGIITVTNGAGTINIGATGAGSGDVVGPNSSGTNQIARFVDTTGKLIGPGAWSDDSNDFYGVAGALNMQFGFVYIPSGTGGAPTVAPSQAGTLTNRCAMYFDQTNNKLYVYDGAWIAIN
jgi:hypothetical protein